MKKIKNYLWQICFAVFFAVYYATRNNNQLMNLLWKKILLPLIHGINHLCSLTSVSVGEVLIIGLGVGCFFYLTMEIRRLISQKEKKKTLKRLLKNIICIGLSVYAGFCLLWGTIYATDSFQKQSGIIARGGTPEELLKVTAYYAIRLAELSDQVPRDENGNYIGDYRVILEKSSDEYENVVRKFPFLHATHTTPKAFISSKGLSYMDFTGFYFPFTGEANLNIDSPKSLLASVAMHELTHQCGIASEQECNFVGIVGAAESDDPEIAYSGYLQGYIYLGNALHDLNQDVWQVVVDFLPNEVRLDLTQNNEYWAQFKGPVNTTAQKVYDGFLKANGDELGIQSYGTVVDMLIAYYIG